MLNNYFDKIYILNLKKRSDRLNELLPKLESLSIDNFKIFNGIDGSLMKNIWRVYGNKYFSNENYLACSLSHISIWNDAILNGYKKILILEDDVKIINSINEKIVYYNDQIPENWDLLYLGFIPLSDDCSMWDYKVINDQFISDNVFKAKNLWGLYSYAIGENLMKHTIEVYKNTFPMEIDRYFVENIQQNWNCLGITPQLFSVDDGWSDNSKRIETGMPERSIDHRFENKINYI
jgi:GR25 family glycosyltransferase involved in LPS biosynthesis